MKQTPIKFLIERLAENGILHSSDIHKANEMFKQQIMDSYNEGVDMAIEEKPYITAEQYYNETYGYESNTN
jgi:TPP-dependent pyruvate/acetoin dehydrogenase alpha subunit